MSVYYLLKRQGHFLGLAMVQVPRRARFDPRPVRVRFVVKKVSLGQVLLRVLSFSPAGVVTPLLHSHLHCNTVVISVCCHQCPSRARKTVGQLL